MHVYGGCGLVIHMGSSSSAPSPTSSPTQPTGSSDPLASAPSQNSSVLQPSASTPTAAPPPVEDLAWRARWLISGTPDVAPSDSQISYIRGLTKKLNLSADEVLLSASTKRLASIVIDQLLALLAVPGAKTPRP